MIKEIMWVYLFYTPFCLVRHSQVDQMRNLGGSKPQKIEETEPNRKHDGDPLQPSQHRLGLRS